MSFSFDSGSLTALLTVIVIDVALAGDNAIAVGLAAAGLPEALRPRVIALGSIVATGLRIALALVAMRLLAIVGLTLAGGLLLLYVAWKLYLELRQARAPGGTAAAKPSGKSFGAALAQVLAADVSMSLDNVLAIAGAARDNVAVLAAGLAVSVALMGLASALIARLMARHRWIGWVGLAAVTVVALRLIHDGGLDVFHAVRHG